MLDHWVDADAQIKINHIPAKLTTLAEYGFSPIDVSLFKVVLFTGWPESFPNIIVLRRLRNRDSRLSSTNKHNATNYVLTSQRQKVPLLATKLMSVGKRQ